MPWELESKLAELVEALQISEIVTIIEKLIETNSTFIFELVLIFLRHCLPRDYICILIYLMASSSQLFSPC